MRRKAHGLRLGAMVVAVTFAVAAATAIRVAPLRAQDADPRAEPPRGTGLPLPRFASLRADEVYMRAGPGSRYPIEWIYRRRGLPMQIVAEFDAWRKVRDVNGTVGWIHRAMLTGKRMALVTAGNTTLLRAPDVDAPVVARAETGVVAALLACEKAWCMIEAKGLAGWVPRTALWGTLPGEKLD